MTKWQNISYKSINFTPKWTDTVKKETQILDFTVLLFISVAWRKDSQQSNQYRTSHPVSPKWCNCTVMSVIKLPHPQWRPRLWVRVPAGPTLQPEGKRLRDLDWLKLLIVDNSGPWKVITVANKGFIQNMLSSSFQGKQLKQQLLWCNRRVSRY